jgi:adenosylcobinamide-GDP ribazoletransferase
VAAALALAVLAMVTGALHEDGLADTVDGFWGGRDRDRRLSIMKDSRIGSYGALALILSVLLRWSALAALFGGGAGLLALMAVGALSRASMAGVMALLPFARPGGLAAGTGHPPILAVLTGGGLALLLALASVGPAALAAALAALVAAAAVGALAWHRIGGQTGDVLGAAQQAAEMAGLVVLAALLR